MKGKKNMYYIKLIIKVFYGWLLSVLWFRKRQDYYWLIWGHIGEAVYALSLIQEVKRIREIKNIHLIVISPYDQIAELYKTEYTDLKVVKSNQLGSIIEYANSPMCFHKNLLGHGWKWDENKWYSDLLGVYIPGFEYKVRDLKVPYSTKHNAITQNISESDITFSNIIKKYEIEKGKSVILVPYAQSAKMLSDEKWENLVTVLNKCGYKTYTNVKNNTELPITGSMAIQIPLKYVISVVNYAGSAISIRCGLTDLLSVGDCDCETLYVIENQEDETTVEIWTTKLGKENMLYRKKWYVRKNEDYDFFIEEMKKKYVSK